jgi:hypothetical protein
MHRRFNKTPRNRCKRLPPPRVTVGGPVSLNSGLRAATQVEKRPKDGPNSRQSEEAHVRFRSKADIAALPLSHTYAFDRWAFGARRSNRAGRRHSRRPVDRCRIRRPAEEPRCVDVRRVGVGGGSLTFMLTLVIVGMKLYLK